MGQEARERRRLLPVAFMAQNGIQTVRSRDVGVPFVGRTLLAIEPVEWTPLL